MRRGTAGVARRSGTTLRRLDAASVARPATAPTGIEYRGLRRVPLCGCRAAVTPTHRMGKGRRQVSDTIVAYEGNLRCRARHDDSGAILVTDAPKDNHGLGEGFSPRDLLSVSLGGCILSIMGIAARSMDIDIAGATATVSKEMANAPRRIAHMAVVVKVPGVFDDRQRRKLEAAAHACPVHNALGIAAPITIEWVG